MSNGAQFAARKQVIGIIAKRIAHRVGRKGGLGFDAHMGYGNAVGHGAKTKLIEPDLAQHAAQLFRQGEHANGFRQAGVGFG